MSKRKRTCLTISEKLDILKRLDAGETLTAVATKYSVGKSTVCDLKKNRSKILDYIATADVVPGNRKSLKRSAHPNVEKAVITWLLQQRASGTPVSGELICEKAKFYYKQLTGEDDFKGSSGWLQNFKNRYGIRRLSMSGKKLTSDPLAAITIKKQLLTKMKELELTADQLYSTNESGLFWKMPQKTLDYPLCTSGRKQSKERINFIRKLDERHEELSEMTDDEILQSTEDIEQDEEDETEESAGVSWSGTHGEVVAFFGKCINWARSNGESPEHILLLEQMQGRARKLELDTVKQCKINDFFQDPL